MAVMEMVDSRDGQISALMQRAIGRENRLQASDVARELGVRLGEAIMILDGALADGMLEGCLAEGYWIAYSSEDRDSYDAGNVLRGTQRRGCHAERYVRAQAGEPSARMKAILDVVRHCPGRESAISAGVIAQAVGITTQSLCNAVKTHREAGRLPGEFRHEKCIGYWWKDNGDGTTDTTLRSRGASLRSTSKHR